VLLPRAAEVYGVFLARQFMQSLPDELLEAARLDGASEWTIFWRIVLPLSKPAIAVLLLLTFLARWNDFSWPLVVLKEIHSLTLPVGLSLLQGEYGTDWTSIMAMALISVAPVLVLFVALQRYFVQGIARTGIK
jgi:alpha-1,4-digalacturonate transport system permease protein